jgi:hypothetical protein
MSNVSEHFEAMQHHLAQGQTRAERLARLLAHPLDEVGRPSLFVRPEARSLLSASLIRAADSAAELGIELYDFRWTAVVTLLHNASTFVRTATAREAGQVAELLRGMQIRTVQLRFRREVGEVKVRLS